MAQDRPSNSEASDSFTTTRWSAILDAGGSDERARAALEHLCGAYWYPLYAFVRRRGYSAPDAEDLTQGFFASLLTRNDWIRVNPTKGRFRAFLVASLKHYLSNERDKVRAQKRGGQFRHVSIEWQTAEGRYRREPADVRTAEQLFERRWAMTLLDRAIDRLRARAVDAGTVDQFEILKRTLIEGRGAGGSYAEMADQLGISEGAVKVAVHRLRRQYRDTLVEQIADTVSDSSEIEDEIRHLLSAVGR